MDNLTIILIDAENNMIRSFHNMSTARDCLKVISKDQGPLHRVSIMLDNYIKDTYETQFFKDQEIFNSILNNFLDNESKRRVV